VQFAHPADADQPDADVLVSIAVRAHDECPL